MRSALLRDDGRIRETILERATQTNEVGRLATLVPAFTNLAADRPVGLLEAGASAGLCLFPDRWSYRWDTDTGPVALQQRDQHWLPTSPVRRRCRIGSPRSFGAAASTSTRWT